MIAVLDIETVQAPREEWARLMGIEGSRKAEQQDNQASDLFLHAEAQEKKQKEDEAYEKSSFDGTFSRIVCIGMILLSNDLQPRGAVSWVGSQEQDLLTQFWSKLGQERPSLFVTHNGLGFDLPFIKKRSVIHQVKPTMEISLARFRTEPVFDTMAVWSNWDARGWVKLDVLARALNVETKSGSGAQVAGMWAEGKRVELAEYCLQDTYVTYACYCRMKFHSPLSREAVLVHQDIVELEK